MTGFEKWLAFMAAMFAVLMLFHIGRKLDEIADLLRKQRNSN